MTLNSEEQKRKEILVLKDFLSLSGKNFQDNLLKIDCNEPIDLEYDGQGYQITTCAGSRMGEILSSSKKTFYNNSEQVKSSVNFKNGITTRTSLTYNVATEDLKPILEKKALSADKDVVLLISKNTSDPFNDQTRTREYSSACIQNRNLVEGWKAVYLIHFSKQLIPLKPSA